MTSYFLQDLEGDANNCIAEADPVDNVHWVIFVVGPDRQQHSEDLSRRGDGCAQRGKTRGMVI